MKNVIFSKSSYTNLKHFVRFVSFDIVNSKNDANRNYFLNYF